MFTGLVKELGTLVEASAGRGSSRLVIESPWAAADLEDGESIAVDGVCLTVVSRRGRRFGCDAVAETLARTTLGSLRPGDRVHLERSLRPADRIGGHLVSGHVDGVATVRRVTRRGDDWKMRVSHPAGLGRYIAPKGSVALQGVSLTVAAVGRGSFEVALIPETLRRTTFGASRAGRRLNLEVDLVARYLERLVPAAGRAGRRGA